jgi:hypothetical protein
LDKPVINETFTDDYVLHHARDGLFARYFYPQYRAFFFEVPF